MAVRFTPRHSSTSATPPQGVEALFTQAVTRHGAGQTSQAAELYRAVLALEPKHAKALELCGIACMQLERYAEASQLLREALLATPDSVSISNNLAVTLKNSGDLQGAASVLRAALQFAPEHADSHNNLGAVLVQAGEITGAAESFLNAIESNATHTAATQNLLGIVSVGNAAQAISDRLQPRASALPPALQALLAAAQATQIASAARAAPEDPLRALLGQAHAAAEKGERARALQIYQRYLKSDPDNPNAWVNVGVLYRQGLDHRQAVQAFQQAAKLDAQSALAWNNLGICLLDLGDLTQARQALERAANIAPDMASVHSNLGMLARAEQNVGLAIAGYERAIELDADLQEAHFNLGNLHYEYGDHARAHACFERAAKLDPQNPEAAYSLGITSAAPGGALAQLGRALQLRPHYPEAEFARVYAQLQSCDWTDLPARLERVDEMMTDPSGPALSPYWMLLVSDSRSVQLQCARKWVDRKMPPVVPFPAPQRAHTTGAALRVGLLSGDLRAHAVGHLLRDLLPAIDPTVCTFIGYDVSPEDGSGTRRQLLKALHTHRPVAMLGMRELASRIREDEVDVLLDLSGFTQHSRSKVLALRPAPVQVSYLGFPGSMGWNAVDWLIADDTLIPVAHEADYAERIARLPGCYQPPIHVASTSGSTPSRADLGLPTRGLVFACFGNASKLRPELVEVWMRLLKATPGSVLWLARINDLAEANLRSFARQHGVDAARLIFAPIVSFEEHSARLPVADLFLDTTPYGSGITAAQTLHAGVPMLTVLGQTYVGRMAASLLRTLGLEQLIASDLADYERRALQLAQDDALRTELRARLAHSLHHTPALDVQQFVRAFEQLLNGLSETVVGGAKNQIHQHLESTQ